jgi:hypothetical protein
MKTFDIADLKLKPEQLKNSKPVEVGNKQPRRQRQQREFVMLTKPRLDLLMKATKLSSWRVFCGLVLIDWKRPGQPIRLGNLTLGRGQIGRKEKRGALAELEALGLISVERREKRSPLITVLI